MILVDFIIKERTILMSKDARKLIRSILIKNNKHLCIDDKLTNKFSRERIRLNNDELLVVLETLGDVVYDYKDNEQSFIFGLLDNLN